MGKKKKENNVDIQMVNPIRGTPLRKIVDKLDRQGYYVVESENSKFISYAQIKDEFVMITSKNGVVCFPLDCAEEIMEEALLTIKDMKFRKTEGLNIKKHVAI